MIQGQGLRVKEAKRKTMGFGQMGIGLKRPQEITMWAPHRTTWDKQWGHKGIRMNHILNLIVFVK